MALKINEPIIVAIEYVCNKLAMFLPIVLFGLIYTQDEIIKTLPNYIPKIQISSDPIFVFIYRK